ncbi:MULTISPECIES: sulfurtransferase TusA family protein [unclassified Sphingomonas]|uniref:sulfurtransferase TusA family protein n=1 Tax=unclassified Sphingomonas TaxID=196159 RepID=UPI0035A8E38F
MTVHIDARGMRCPWPAIRLARALRAGVLPIEIIVDDPAATRELTAVAKAAGLTIQPISNGLDTVFRIAASDGVNVSFTRAL